MPHAAKNHSEMQKSVCCMCWKKPKNLRNMTPLVRGLFKQLVFTGIDEESWSWLPKVICLACMTELRHAKTDSKRTLKHIDYVSLVPPLSRVMTRTQVDQRCECSVCTVGRLQVPRILSKSCYKEVYDKYF